ncbi:hypothetical protein QBC40DRAFT_65911 [Triangularia verruculosa]|uniref:Uncharacterized protein n=1 Tax=Triangularia verruculosa TaxID=2587418 RepID=A0AAN6XR70_9PEZI|nr:hypothetical protein QBC40DRAFT_65911 [Triangularia verruculosa]
MAESSKALFDQISRSESNASILHDKAPAWVSSPAMRGTSDILWSCLLTLFACVYTALHLNIPDINTSNRQLLCNKLKWMAVALLAPEIILYYALTQYLEARDLIKFLRQLEVMKSGRSNPVMTRPSTITRYFRSIGRFLPRISKGFGVPTVRSSGGDAGQQEGGPEQGLGGKIDSDREQSPEPHDAPFDLKFGFFVVMGGLDVQFHVADGQPRGHLILSAGGVATLAEHDLEIFRVPRSVIDNQEKADTFKKLLVLIQVSWLFIEAIARKAYGLPLSLLELHTVVHVVCAIIMYLLWLKKPLDLRAPYLIQSASGSNFQTRLQKMVKDRPGLRAAPYDWIYARRGDMVDFDFEESTSRHGFVYVVNYIAERRFFTIVMLFLPLVFGSVHLSAWNFDFPSTIESTLWKVSCLVIVSAVPGILLTLCLVVLLHKMTEYCKWYSYGFVHRVADALVSMRTSLLWFAVALLILVRVFLVVESFISLRSVPLGVYYTPAWIQMIPHI